MRHAVHWHVGLAEGGNLAADLAVVEEAPAELAARAGVAGCRTTGQIQTDGNIDATSSENEAYADAPETNTDAAKAHTDVAPKP